MITKCGIYKITNDINGKIYIGQSVSINRRFWTHGAGKIPNCRKLFYAIKKYGKKNFSLSIIQEIDPSNSSLSVILTEREQYYLDTLQPFDDIGYNISRTATPGLSLKGVSKKGNLAKGKNNIRNKPVCQYDSTGKFVATYFSIQDASNQLQINRMAITNNIKGRTKSAGGFHWSFTSQPPIIIPRNTRAGHHHTNTTKQKIGRANSGTKNKHYGKPAHNRKPVGMFNKDELISKFESARDAAKFIQRHHSVVCKACNNGNIVVGFTWKYL